ncbi:hypothetical protein GCM10010334_10000 [Streptomyces finlayi]|uniref:Uncharacterized protein n=1 Tax=Streptomyces finlayi TaxID=67296 RepID=A0A918WTM7_9ACTN|nr:hypothetical protein [Streptomyces finlayi]GHC82070.1 hypothetical protein GCM10010334_10000 [Streptomyces finlayi]
MADHPAWQESSQGDLVRVVEFTGVVWVAHWVDESLVLRPVGSDAMDAPQPAYALPIRLPYLPEAALLADELARLGTVLRLNNPSLWDALLGALLRKGARSCDAKIVYRRMCSAHGRTVDTFAGPLSLAPTPERILDLPDEAFAAAGAALDRDAMRAAAEAYRDHAPYWHTLDVEQLVTSLATVDHVDHWIAAVAAADYRGDFSVYPITDLSLRTLAHKIAPDMQLPSSDHEFATLWRKWAPDRTGLHTLTQFTLAWGTHARTRTQTAR